MSTSLAIAAGLAVMTGFGAGIGCCIAAGRTTSAMATQPSRAGKLSSTMLLGAAMASSASIYGLVIALIIIFS